MNGMNEPSLWNVTRILAGDGTIACYRGMVLRGTAHPKAWAVGGGSLLEDMRCDFGLPAKVALKVSFEGWTEVR